MTDERVGGQTGRRVADSVVPATRLPVNPSTRLPVYPSTRLPVYPDSPATLAHSAKTAAPTKIDSSAATNRGL